MLADLKNKVSLPLTINGGNLKHGSDKMNSEQFRAHQFVYFRSLSVDRIDLPFSIKSADYRTSVAWTGVEKINERSTAWRWQLGKISNLTKYPF